MLTQILSISSILLGIYLLIIFLKNAQMPKPFPEQTEYHMGCFSPDNQLSHSISIREYLTAINTESQKEIASSQSFEVAHKINYNEISKSVARDFEKYLNEYYQIKTKSVYEQSFYRSLNLAEEKFHDCNRSVSELFSPEQCRSDWQSFLDSKNKYQDLKKILQQKIQRKEQQQRKISYLILDTNYSDADEYERNLTGQIDTLNSQLENINAQRISILAKKSPIEVFIATNRTRLQQDEKLYDQCIKNMKIITFCNDLTKELNTIKLTFSKQDIQTKIQRKRFIIDSFKNAIRNAEKIGDEQMVRISKESLQKNIRQLELLIASIESFQSFEESYCSKCSDEKIAELRLQIENTSVTIKTLTTEYNQYVDEEDQLGKQAIKVSHSIGRIEEERDFRINSNICVTPECQEQRSKDIKDLGRVLNEMKKEVLDYKFIIEEHKVSHNNKITGLNEWTGRLSAVVDCLNDKQYYQALRDRTPEQGQEYDKHINRLQSKLVEKLEALGHLEDSDDSNK